MEIGLAGQYGSFTSKRTFSTGNVIDFESSGLENPIISLRGRIFEQLQPRLGINLPFNLDLITTYSPDLIKAQEAFTSTVTGQRINGGTMALGGDETTVSVSAARVMKSLTVQAVFDASFYGKSVILGSPPNINDYSPSQAYSLALSSQYRYSKRLSFDAGGTIYLSDQETDQSSRNTNAVYTKTDIRGSIYGELDLEIISKRLALSIEYVHFIPYSFRGYSLSTGQLMQTTSNANDDQVYVILRTVMF